MSPVCSRDLGKSELLQGVRKGALQRMSRLWSNLALFLRISFLPKLRDKNQKSERIGQIIEVRII